MSGEPMGVLENASYQLKRCADVLARFDAAFVELQKLRDELLNDDPYEGEWLIMRLEAILRMPTANHDQL